MKKAAKVFILIEMILSGFLIYPIIFGIYALNKLDTAKTKKELTTASWLTFVFCSRVGGAFMLWLKDDDLNAVNQIILIKDTERKQIEINDLLFIYHQPDETLKCIYCLECLYSNIHH